MTVSRTRRGGKALMIFAVDSTPPPELVERVRAEGFDDARVIELSGSRRRTSARAASCTFSTIMKRPRSSTRRSIERSP